MFAHHILRFFTADPGEIPPIGSYSRFQYSVHPKPVKSKPYFRLTFPTPPDKSTVHQARFTCKEIADYKSMPFIQLVGDQPVFTLITEIKNENKDEFKKIVPVLGSFHLEMAFMNEYHIKDLMVVDYPILLSLLV